MELSQYRVPWINIAAIMVSLLISVGIPMILGLFWENKKDASLSSALKGAGTFVVFALILESIVHNIVIKVMGQDSFMELPFYAIYGGLAAGLFEEVGRYIVMRLFMKKKFDKTEAIMFGIGHGGVESILLVGFTCVSNIVVSVMLNLGQGALLLKGTDSSLQKQMVEQLSPLWLSGPGIFLWTGAERISAIAFHICASYLVYRAVKDKKFSLCLLAVILHALMDGVFVTIQKISGSMVLTEGFIFVFALIFAIITIRVYKSEYEE